MYNLLTPTKYRDLDRLGDMTTQKQIAANRRNSRKSTGPSTRAGKAASKLNAMKHGLLAEHVVVRGEDPAEFASFYESLVDEFLPQGPLEEQLVERVAVCGWRLRRIYRIEAGIFTLESLTIELDRARNETEKYQQDVEKRLFPSGVLITDAKRHSQAAAQAEETARLRQEESLALSVAFKQDVENANAISKLSRYEAPIEKSYFRALHELQRVLAARQNGQAPASIAVDVTVDGPSAAPTGDD